MACFMLRVLYPTAGTVMLHHAFFAITNVEYVLAQIEIIRSRDPKVLDPLPILVDVGSVYDPATGRYDHHQRV
jgi:uncharacterized UPF0160 family protein